MAGLVRYIDSQGRESEIDVNLLIDPSPGSSYLSEFFDVTNIASASIVEVASKTVSESGFKLLAIDIGGDCKALFNVYINTDKIGCRRINYLQFSNTIFFGGLEIDIADELIVEVENFSQNIGKFEARIIYSVE